MGPVRATGHFSLVEHLSFRVYLKDDLSYVSCWLPSVPSDNHIGLKMSVTQTNLAPLLETISHRLIIKIRHHGFKHVI